MLDDRDPATPPPHPAASVIVLTYNSAAHLSACLDGLGAQTYRDFEVIVVDNASTDGSADLAGRCFPEALVVRNPVNTGYAAGCNTGFYRARGEYLAVIGPDCEPQREWLAALVAACREPGVGLATSMVRHHDHRARINTCGNDVHVLGLGFCHGLDDPWEMHAEPAPVASISGCSFAMPRKVLEHVGGFDEDFFMYCEDTDLSLRAWLAGYRVVYVPNSVAFHRYRLDIRPQKFFHLERNRHLVLLKNLRGRTLLALLPALLAGDVMMWTYAALRGRAFLGAKVRAWRWLITHRDLVREGRARIAAARRCGDPVLLRLMTPRLSDRQVLGANPVAQGLGRVANTFFAAALALAHLFAR
jgi:GT2 family glycosyltransferase